ncbi:MAG: protein kinase [Candidatus Obscuribacterales bacterium]|jgi:serine/threonine protein kinase|nr:protein kinase [Candidatus Obscuribacterales bacterium]
MASILILDDSLELAMNMRAYLEQKGHTVTETHSVAEAYAMLSSQDYDLLILDWDLPDGTGIDVCQGYRDRGGLSGVLMLTGHNSQDDKVTGLTAGADDYLTKPVNIPEFGARIAALLRRVTINKRPEPPRAFDETLVGHTFAGTYKIESVLGKGMMGIVYKASHTAIQRTAAIKILSARYEGVADRKRFEREAQAMNMLDHPSLIKIYEFGITEQNVPFIIMEYVEGSPLSLVLSKYKSIPLKQALPLFIDICEGLEHAHTQSIIHRDLKPANIIISEDGKRAKILDLGLAKSIADETNDLKLTFAGEIFGSPFYMSPEQATNKALDLRSDIFSLGCVIYETLTGEVPFPGYSFVDVTNAKLEGTPPSICNKFPDAEFPARLDQVIQKSLEVKPAKRQNSVSELKQDLLDIQANLEKEPSPAGKGASRIISFMRNLLDK